MAGVQATSLGGLRSRAAFGVEDAAFWTNRLPRYAAGMLSRADRYAVLAGTLSAVTGLSIWGTVAASADPRAQIAVGFVGLAAAVVALIPKTCGFADCAQNAFDIDADYAKVEGGLIVALQGLQAGQPGAMQAAEAARQKLGEIRARKERLHPYPGNPEAERQRLLPGPFEPKFASSVAFI